MIPFAPWEPDKADLDAAVTRVARNVLPGANSYRPFPGLAQYGLPQLPAQARGLTMARQTTGSWAIYAGTQAGLFRYGAGAWTNVSRTAGGAYGVPANEFWRFQQFGQSLIAVNANDAPQVINVDSGATFAALGGAPPSSRNVGVVGDFLVMSSLTASVNRVQWSGLNNTTIWTPGASLSDYQDFPDGGRVTGVAGGKIGYVLQEYAINRMRFLPGSDEVFEFIQVVDGKGCLSPSGYATIGGIVYFIAEDGFFAYSGGGLNPIGAERVNRWFLNNADTSRLSSLYCVADPYRPRILWAFYKTVASTVFDMLLAYDWQLNRWSYAEISAQMWGGAATPGLSLEDIPGPLEAVPFSLDSRAYEGGRPTLAAIDTSRRLSFAEGASLAATIETQEANIIPGKRAFLTEVRPSVDTEAATVRVGYRERFADPVAYTAPAAMETTGVCPVMASGRLMRAEVNMPAGANWTHAVGVDVTAIPDGDV